MNVEHHIGSHGKDRSCEISFSFAVKKKMETLEIAMGLAGSYASCGISPQTDGMPVIPQKAANLPAGRFFNYDF